MDFIEQWLHVSPDGGNGMLELAYIVVAAGFVTALVRVRKLRSRRSRR